MPSAEGGKIAFLNGKIEGKEKTTRSLKRENPKFGPYCEFRVARVTQNRLFQLPSEMSLMGSRFHQHVGNVDNRSKAGARGDGDSATNTKAKPCASAVKRAPRLCRRSPSLRL